MHIYENLSFPAPPESRPYTFINMVATIDGKTISGEREEAVNDLGSAVDHLLMNRTIEAADAVLIGATTLRASGDKWNPKCPVRIVLSRSGNVNRASNFLAGGTGIVANTDDLAEFMADLRHNHNIKKLLILGGSEVNAQFLAADLVDELFLTVAPKIKLGADLPTYAGGNPLSREAILQFRLKEHHVHEDEIFLRYSRAETR